MGEWWDGWALPKGADWLRGELRIHGEPLIKFATILGVSADEILGLEKPATNGPVKNRRILRRLHQLDKLPKRDQDALLRTVDAFLTKAPLR